MFSVLSAALIGLSLLLLPAAACQAETSSLSHSVSSPGAGFQFWIDDSRGGELLLRTHGKNNVLGGTLQADCPALSWQTQPLVQGQWLGLSLATANAEQAARVEDWLDSPLDALRPAVSPRELLRQMVLGLDAGLAALAPSRGRPAQLQFVLHLSEGDCCLLVQQEMNAAQARERLVFPLAANEAVLRWQLIGELQVLKIIGTMAHESAHMLQMYPFTAQRALSHEQGRPFKLHADHTLLSIDVELGALMVERCLMQAVAPEPRFQELHALAWRDHPDLFRLDMPDPGMRSMYAEHFENQRRVLGRAFVGKQDDRRLSRLFAVCAMALERDASLRGQTPDAAETARGQAALRAIRRWVAKPYTVDGMDYATGPLTRAERSALQRQLPAFKKASGVQAR